MAPHVVWESVLEKGLNGPPVYQISTLSQDPWLVQPLAFSVLRIGRGRVVVGIPGKVY